MKKLMIAAAAAAMVGGAFAGAQVYDVSLSGKTTTAKDGNAKNNPYLLADGKIVYRNQTTVSFKGLIWGCDCDTIVGEWKIVNDDNQTVGGNILWETKSGGYILNDTFGWDFLQAIGLKGDQVEGVAVIANDDDSFDVRLAGFGKNKFVDDCGTYVTSISGNAAGWTFPICLNVGECLFCEDTTGCADSEVWEICDCVTLMNADKTAFSGTWSVKYNSSLSKKLSKSVIGILDIYNFKKLPLVEAAIIAKEAEVRGDHPDCSDEEAVLAAAQALLKTAQDGLADAQEAYDYYTDDAAVWATLTNAQTVAINAARAVKAAEGAVDATNEIVKASQSAYDKLFFQVNTNQFTITLYIEKTDKEKVVATEAEKVVVKGFDNLVANIPTSGYAQFKIESTEDMKTKYRSTWKFDQAVISAANIAKVADKVAEVKKEMVAAKAKLVADEANLKAAEAAVVTAVEARNQANRAQDDAQYDWNNRTQLAGTAQVAVEQQKAKVVEYTTKVVAAQKALKACQEQ